MVDEIKTGYVVVAFQVDGVETELRLGGRYLVKGVDKKGEHYQDWYVNLIGVDRKEAYGFCYNRFIIADPNLPANIVFKEAIEEVLNLPKSPACFSKLVEWRAYKEAIESLVPALRES